MSGTFWEDLPFGEAAQQVVERHWQRIVAEANKLDICMPIRKPMAYKGKEVKSEADIPSRYRLTDMEWYFEGGADSKLFTKKGIFPLEVKAESNGKFLSRNNNGKEQGKTTEEPTIGIELWSNSDDNRTLIGNGWLHAYLYPEDHRNGTPQTTPHWIAFAACPGKDGKDVFCYVVFKWEELGERLVELSIGMIHPEWKLDYTQFEGKSKREIRKALSGMGMGYAPINMWHVPLSEVIDLGEVYWLRDLSDDELSGIAAKQASDYEGQKTIKERVWRRYHYLKDRAVNIVHETQ